MPICNHSLFSPTALSNHPSTLGAILLNYHFNNPPRLSLFSLSETSTIQVLDPSDWCFISYLSISLFLLCSRDIQLKLHTLYRKLYFHQNIFNLWELFFFLILWTFLGNILFFFFMNGISSFISEDIIYSFFEVFFCSLLYLFPLSFFPSVVSVSFILQLPQIFGDCQLILRRETLQSVSVCVAIAYRLVICTKSVSHPSLYVFIT